MTPWLLRTVLLALLAISACSQSSSRPQATAAPAQNATNVVQNVQDAAVSACGFLPTTRSIEDLVTAVSAQIKQASQLANQICTALKSAPESRSAINGPVTLT